MGGHGGLNILPQKSWNVYGQKNRQKVAEDEAAEREKQEKDREQQTKGDRVARVNALRKQGPAQEGSIVNKEPTEENLRHINFWSQHEAASRNPEAEAEKAAQLRKRGDPKTQTSDARFDERFAVLHGQTGPAPWYARRTTTMYSADPVTVDHGRSAALASVRSVLDKSGTGHPPQLLVPRPHRSGRSASGQHTAGMQSNMARLELPFNDVGLGQSRSPKRPSPRSRGKHAKGKKHKKRSRERRGRSRSRSPEPPAARRSRHKSHKSHKSKRRRRSTGTPSSDSSDSGEGDARPTQRAAAAATGFEALRRERLERERAEAQRSRQLLRDHLRR
eukprot:jgi/Ulvmu1/7935/UM004_0168.1